MGQFVCKVADSNGRVYSQVEAARSESEARQKLADRGLYVYSVRERSGLLPTSVESPERAVRIDDFLVFNQQFNTLIKAGLPILKALDLLAERAAAPRLRPLLVNVRDRVRDGALLSEAFEQLGVFPAVYTTSLMAGEKSGNLSGVLDSYIAYQRVISSFRKRLLASLIYPVFLVVAATVILTGIINFVIPRFASLFQEMNVPLPFITTVLISVAQDLRLPLLIGVVGLILGGVAVYGWSRTERGGMVVDRFRLRVPLYGNTWLKFQVAQVARTISTLLAGGIPLVSALGTAAGASNSRLISTAISEATERVREGQALSSSLAGTGLFPDLAMEMIEVGEATGALGPMLNSVAEFYEEDVTLRMTAAIAWIEPLILVFMGVVVAFILLALYTPIFSFSVSAR